MNLVVTILIGLGVGVMVELILPGHSIGELFLLVCLGIAGALVARYVGEVEGWFEPRDPGSFIASAVGAIVLLLLYGVTTAIFRRGWRRRQRHSERGG